MEKGGVERNVQDRRKNIWREARELCWGSRGELNDRVLISTRTSPPGVRFEWKSTIPGTLLVQYAVWVAREGESCRAASTNRWRNCCRQ